MNAALHQSYTHNILAASLKCDLCSKDVIKVGNWLLLYKLQFRAQLYHTPELHKLQFRAQIYRTTELHKS